MKKDTSKFFFFLLFSLFFFCYLGQPFLPWLTRTKGRGVRKPTKAERARGAKIKANTKNKKTNSDKKRRAQGMEEERRPAESKGCSQIDNAQGQKKGSLSDCGTRRQKSISGRANKGRGWLSRAATCVKKATSVGWGRWCGHQQRADEDSNKRRYLFPMWQATTKATNLGLHMGQTAYSRRWVPM